MKNKQPFNILRAPAQPNRQKAPSAQVALIAGGGNGLGAATAQVFARRGWRVAVADIDGEQARKVAAQCNRIGPGSFAIVVDLAKPTAPKKMVDSVIKRWGQIDVLVNCASVAPVEAFLDMTASAWEVALLVNVRAVALAMSAAGRKMTAQRRGHIINITSAAARMGEPYLAAYAATKAAVDALTRCGAVALAPHGVRVNSFSPGMMDTTLQGDIEKAFCRLVKHANLAAFKIERTKRIPAGRRTTPEEMALAIAWLAIDAPEYMTAERMNVTGGLDKD